MRFGDDKRRAVTSCVRGVRAGGDLSDGARGGVLDSRGTERMEDTCYQSKHGILGVLDVGIGARQGAGASSKQGAPKI